MPIESTIFLLNQTKNTKEEMKSNLKDEEEIKKKFKKLSEKFFHYIEHDNNTDNLHSDACLNFSFKSLFFSNENFMVFKLKKIINLIF